MSLFWMFLIAIGIIQVSVFFTTIYLHRTLTHRGMEVHPALATLMHLHLTLFTGIVPREWVAVHRKHHQFSDKHGDPHSPYIFGLWRVFFLNAFYYRNEANNPATVRKYTPDYKPTLIDRIPGTHYGALVGLGLFMLAFGWIWGLAMWAFQGIGYILLNSSINSICHMVGYRNYDNKATNLKSLALFTGGEALHNNHHEYPTSARFALRKGEMDPAWPLILLLERLGLAKINRVPIAKVA